MRRTLCLASVHLALLSAASLAADFCPVIDCATGYLIGARSGNKWLDSQHAGKALAAGTKLRVFSLTREVGITKCGKPHGGEDVCPEVNLVNLTPKPVENTIAIAAPWNPAPRVPKIADVTQPVYQDAVREFLTGKGLRNPKIKIAQILRIDLDGDGEEEVLITATNYGPTLEGTEVPSASPIDSYSVVLLRKVVDGKVRTQLLAGELYRKAAEFNAPSRYKVSGLLDADGDGTLEVIIDSAYYEGGAITILRCGKGEPEKVLSVACGA